MMQSYFVLMESFRVRASLADEFGLRCRSFSIGPRIALSISVNFWKDRAAASERCSRIVRHEFVIGPLCDSNLCSGKAARLYYCTECKWRLLVSGSRVAVLDEDGSPIAGEESINVFEENPCPVLEAFASAQPLLQAQCDQACYTAPE